MFSRIRIALGLALGIILTACTPATPAPTPIPLPPQPTALPLTPSPTPELPSTGVPVIEYLNGGNELLVISSITGKTFDAFPPIPLYDNYNYTFAPDGRTLALITGGKLYLIDLPSWKTRTCDVGLHGWISSIVYSPDGILLALASGDSDSTLRGVDAKNGEVKTSAQVGFSIRKAQFTADGKSLMVYGPQLASTGPAANAGVSVGAPKAALFAASDLRLLWSVELKGIRDGVFPKDPETANTQAIYEPGAARIYQPGVAFAPNRDALYLVHGDEDKLTTVDFVHRKVSTVDVRTKTSLLDQLMALAAGIAYAKGMDGTTKQAIISPDGKFLYVVGNTETVSQRANGNWDITDTPIGLQVISTEDGSLVNKMDTEANSAVASPDGRHIFLTGWNKNGGPGTPWTSWTDIYDASSMQLIKRLDNVSIIPTRRMDGQVILASSSSISNNENYMAVVDPVTWAVLDDWKGPDSIGWLIDLQPTPVAIPADLGFSSSLVQRLSSSGLIILSVQGSKWNGMFQTTSKAAWIETNKGIVEAVFFANSMEAKHIQAASLSNKIAGRYTYKIQASPPTLVDEVTIDSAFPLYFTAQDNMFLITSNADLYETLQRIFSNH